MTTLESSYLEPPRPFRLRSGEDFSLEEKAAELLAQGRKGVTALSDKRDYLTKDQLKLRAQREILNHTGVSDESLMAEMFGQPGMFRREFNPLANSRPTRRTRWHDE